MTPSLFTSPLGRASRAHGTRSRTGAVGSAPGYETVALLLCAWYPSLALPKPAAICNALTFFSLTLTTANLCSQ